jgi:adenylate kinase family enzyme
VIKHRLKVYGQETRPLLEFYGQRLVHRIDSSQSPTDVLRRILDLIAGIR